MVIRIAGRNIATNKQIRFALTPIKGVGPTNIKTILASIHLKFGKQLKVTPEEFAKLTFDDFDEEITVAFRNLIENDYLVESDLRRESLNNIKRLVDLKTWRGLRHKAGLPTRGQTTKTNSRTIRGNKRNTGSSGKIKAAAKT